MGLYAEIDIGDIGPDELTDDETGISVLVDYTSAIIGFIETFMSIATSLCPVRTGNLQGSINAGGIGNMVYAEATAEYAQYVEYGTSRMSAQPFFEPALEEALAELEFGSQQALKDAEEQLQELVEAQMMAEASGRGGSTMDSIMNGLSNILVAIMLLPLLALTTVLEDAMNGNSGSTGGSAYDDSAGVGGIDIIIT